MVCGIVLEPGVVVVQVEQVGAIIKATLSTI